MFTRQFPSVYWCFKIWEYCLSNDILHYLKAVETLYILYLMQSLDHTIILVLCGATEHFVAKEKQGLDIISFSLELV